MPSATNNISRRELLAGAGAGAAALLLEQTGLPAQTPPGTTVVFTHTTVANADAVQNDVALVVQGDKIAAIGATGQILKTYPRADVYDGRGKAIFPGRIRGVPVAARYGSRNTWIDWSCFRQRLE